MPHTAAFPAPADPAIGYGPAPAGRTPSRWKPWHKAVLGVAGLLVACTCGVAAFAPDPDPTGTSAPGSSPAAQQLAQAGTPAGSPAATAAGSPAATAAASPAGPAARTTERTAAATTRAATRPSARSATDPDTDATTEPATRAPAEATTAPTQKPTPKPTSKPVTKPAPTPEEEEPTEDEGGGTDPRFGTCGDANDAGYGPYRRGVDPEYDWYRDRDDDGLVCER